MKLYKTDAVILRTRDYREADRLVTLFTRDRGKVQAIARGTRKLKSRKRAVSYTHLTLPTSDLV